MPNDEPMPYSTEPDPKFRPGVEAFSWTPWIHEGSATQIGWVARGRCPHCGDKMNVRVRRTRTVRGTIDAVCNCLGRR